MSRSAVASLDDLTPALSNIDDGAALGYSRPQSYEELRAVLCSGTVRLPKKLRQVAIFVWQHPTIVALGTVTSVASQAGVQPSTLVRFAQTFGYTGFSDLQNIFKAHLAEGGRGSRNPASRDNAPGSQAARLVDGFINSSMASLAGIRDRLEISNFDSVARTLASANLIHVVGFKRAFCLASYVSLALSNLGIRNFALDNVGSTAFELLRCATPSGAVLAVSFTPYNLELAASAAQRGVPVVSLTDSAFSPLAAISKTYLEVVEEDFSGFKSLSATLAVAMALVLRVAQFRGSPAEAAEPSRSN